MRSCNNIAGVYMISWCNISDKNTLSQFPALRTGDCESGLFALLFTHSLFWHMHWLARRKTNDKTQLSASFPWGMKRLNSLHPSLGAWKNKKTNKTKKKPKTCPQCLQSLEVFVFFCFFVFVFLVFLVVFVFCLFRPLWPILAYLGILWPIVALWWCENTARGKRCKTLQGKQCKTHGRTASFSVNQCAAAISRSMQGCSGYMDFMYQSSEIDLCVKYVLPKHHENLHYNHQRKFRSQTSDNMDRWKAELGRGREKRREE